MHKLTTFKSIGKYNNHNCELIYLSLKITNVMKDDTDVLDIMQ